MFCLGMCKSEIYIKRAYHNLVIDITIIDWCENKSKYEIWQSLWIIVQKILKKLT